MKYHIKYVESCRPKIISFKKEEQRNKWLTAFLLASQGNEDNWVDILFKGTIEWEYELCQELKTDNMNS